MQTRRSALRESHCNSPKMIYGTTIKIYKHGENDHELYNAE